MTICKGITKNGKKCRATTNVKGYCRWHTTPIECIVCYEIFNEAVLPCGHSIHRECVQKSADALQEVRAKDGYPPIEDCTCPICRAVVPDMKPKDAPPVQSPIIHNIMLEELDIQVAYHNWEISDRHAPFSWYIWVLLCEQYPDINPNHLINAAFGFEIMINMGVINPYPQRSFLSSFI